MKPIYKTTLIVEVLSEEPLDDPIGLETVNYEINEGSWSGKYWIDKSEILEGEAAIIACQDQGTDPMFFHMDDEEE